MKVATLACVVLCASSAAAQVFSPGVLSKAHAAIDDVTRCTACHEGAAQQPDSRCLSCHREIDVRIRQSRGLHATTRNQRCAACHMEHRGREAVLVAWKPEELDHRRTGFPLLGSHLKNTCRKCHRAALIDDADAQKLVAVRGKTYLGLPRRCSSCHFDEHRGQLGLTCEKCHTPGTFKPASGFDHNDAGFTLTGEHKKVACVKCHARVADPEAHADAAIAPRHTDYARFTNVPHESCVSCHRDPHAGSFGSACTSCHRTTGFRNIVKTRAEDFAFHDTTDFPLRGKHRALACRQCHGPFAGTPAQFRGLAHASCADCHVDGHPGQLDDARSCAVCHSPEGFVPVAFGVADHGQTRFPLRGAHQAVACVACHKRDVGAARLPAPAKASAREKGRPLRVATVRLRVKGDSCTRCHADPHRGPLFATDASDGKQEPKRDCARCHQENAFSPAAFAHDATGFSLQGRHAEAKCGACHSGKGADRYRQAPETCAGCHLDVHAGQFGTPQDTGAACSLCHGFASFKPSTFQHEATFPLEGAHAAARCAACHLDVDVGGRKVRRYRYTPTSCAECHADPHDGRYQDFTP